MEKILSQFIFTSVVFRHCSNIASAVPQAASWWPVTSEARV